VLLASIPLAAALGVLRLEQLFVVAFVTGVLTVFFDVAYQSYLPEIVDREQLADANGKLEASRAISEMAGPILGSTLLQLAAAPFAIALDAVSFVVSAGFLRSIATSNEPVTRSAPGRMITEVSEGIRLVLKHPVLRPIAACSATMNLFYQMLMAVFILYMTTELQVPGGLVGVVFGVGSLSGLGGALLASPSARRFGTGRTLLASTLVSSCGALGIAFGPSQGLAVLPWLIGTQLVLISGVPLYNINQLSLRQAITPPGVRGRVNATNRCLVWGTMPVGALLGGFLGHAIGLQPTIAVSGLGMLAAGLWIALSPVRTLDDVAIGQLADLS
jgi:MFS family permease